jgi:hypothetical protein
MHYKSWMDFGGIGFREIEFAFEGRRRPIARIDLEMVVMQINTCEEEDLIDVVIIDVVMVKKIMKIECAAALMH